MTASDQAKDLRQSITDLLLQVRQGSPDAMDRLFPVVYGELRRIAHRQLQGERPGHETYLKLVDQTRLQWQDRRHFFALASRAMRQTLVDYARRYRAQRRGGGMKRVALTEAAAAEEKQAEQVLAVHEALERLAAMNRRLSQIAECRYFAGLTDEETAEVLGVSARTVERDWVKARGWLYQEIHG